ncbi:conserved hypothetical protein [Tolumonas auensis DSM 9187]|uniref:Multidrug resistance protein MdtA-like barrel-sandwich hybrid domain-containing protein n=1 Tax=Tolumonas auensis (strain DSM 9187 / NBRC 110442 / TA 4) TaxID=595494 RepID=C4LDH7_TOLAT|nr:biotin/lipoyl-binding protein [Tolumonas auensis]ACQ92773.1 conserved hypothetical protein [Tolumonas auensis DSM 9187]
MKIKFHLDKQKNPAQHGGVKINYGAGKRIAFRLRWYLILFLIISPVLIFVWYITKDKVIVESPGILTTEPLTLQMSQDAVISAVNIKQGQHVKQGNLLISLEKPALQAEIKQLEENIQSLDKTLSEEWNKQEILLKQKVSVAERDLKEKNDLYRKYMGFNEHGLLQLEQWANVSQLRVNAELLLLESNRNLHALNQDKISGGAAQYLNELKLRLQLLKARQAELQLMAPMDGEVKDVLVQQGMTIQSGEPLMLYAIRSQPVVMAYLTPSEVQFSGIGQQATVTLPGGETIAATVSEPTKITEKVPTQLSGPFDNNKSALKVVLKLEHMPAQVIEGLSVSVRFHYTKSNLWSHIRNIF